MLKKVLHIQNYSVKIQVSKKEYQLRLKVQDLDETIEIPFNSIAELAAISEILRNENNTFYDISTNEIIIGWEPTGENDPKHQQFT